MSLLHSDPEARRAYPGHLPVTNRYTAGVATERFLRALKDKGQVLGAHCPACEVTYVPARLFCERCLAELTDWRDVGTRGEVHTYTLLDRRLDGALLEEPELVVFVKLEDGGLVHRLGEIDPDNVEIGMRVEAVLKPAAERQGSILDIRYFRPTQD